MHGLQFDDETRHGLPSRVSQAQRKRRYRQQSSIYLAKRLEGSASQYVSSLPPNVTRSGLLECVCLPGGQLVCGTDDGVHILRQTAEAPQWDYVRSPPESQACSIPYPLRNSCSAGFAIGLDSGEFMVVSEGCTSTSTGTHSNWMADQMAAPRRRFGPPVGANISSLITEWNLSSPMRNKDELSTWRDAIGIRGSIVASSWDFWETGSALLAMHTGSDYLGIQDYRKASFRENPTYNYDICFSGDKGESGSHEQFRRCCFVSEHVVATASHTMKHSMRLWDLRMTRKGESGTLLSFPLDTAHELRGRGVDLDTSRSETPTSFVKSIRRIDKDGRVLVSGKHTKFGRDVEYLLVDPLNESVQYLSTSPPIADFRYSRSEALITLGSASLLACPSERNAFNLVDMTEAGQNPLLALDNSQEVTAASVPKRRKTETGCPFPPTGQVIGELRPNITDEYGLEATLTSMAWDSANCRLFGVSQDFDVFTWSL